MPVVSYSMKSTKKKTIGDSCSWPKRERTQLVHGRDCLSCLFHALVAATNLASRAPYPSNLTFSHSPFYISIYRHWPVQSS